MPSGILNLEQAAALLGISEKTLIKLLKEDHLPARKLGREWRFSENRLIEWLAQGDSNDYSNQSEVYFTRLEQPDGVNALLDALSNNIAILREDNHINRLLGDVPGRVSIPDNAELNIIYKKKGDAEKLEFKISWIETGGD